MKISGFDKKWVVPVGSDADELPEASWWHIGPDGEPLFPVRSWLVSGGTSADEPDEECRLCLLHYGTVRGVNYHPAADRGAV
jgi:hypothetical protein